MAVNSLPVPCCITLCLSYVVYEARLVFVACSNGLATCEVTGRKYHHRILVSKIKTSQKARLPDHSATTWQLKGQEYVPCTRHAQAGLAWQCYNGPASCLKVVVQCVSEREGARERRESEREPRIPRSKAKQREPRISLCPKAVQAQASKRAPYQCVCLQIGDTGASSRVGPGPSCAVTLQTSHTDHRAPDGGVARVRRGSGGTPHPKRRASKQAREREREQARQRTYIGGTAIATPSGCVEEIDIAKLAAVENVLGRFVVELAFEGTMDQCSRGRLARFGCVEEKDFHMRGVCKHGSWEH